MTTLETIKQSIENYSFLSGMTHSILEKSLQEHIQDNSVWDSMINGYWIEKDSSLDRNLQGKVILEQFNSLEIKSVIGKQDHFILE
jgi:hypothetical protein